MKDIVLDQFGDFGPNEIASMLIAMICAAFLVFVLGFAVKKEARHGRSTNMVLSALAASAVSVVMGSLPMAVALLAVVLLARLFVAPPTNNSGGIYTVVALVIGLICGARAVMIAAIAVIPLFLLLRLLNNRS